MRWIYLFFLLPVIAIGNVENAHDKAEAEVVSQGKIDDVESVNKALGEFAWVKRQLIVFTPDTNDEKYLKFLEVKKHFEDDFTERYMHTWTINRDEPVLLEGEVQELVTGKGFQQRFNVEPDEFAVILVGYDQWEKLRQSEFNIDLLLAEIDQMPMRMQEMEEQAMERQQESK